MTMVHAQVKQWGNSYGIIIPRDIVRVENISPGDYVKAEITKNKPIDGFGVLKGIGRFDDEDDEHGDLF
jgi:hypothetical protein